MRPAPLVAVIGGANIDIIAVPEKRVLPGDSAPGRIRFVPGGVGRNIAESLALTSREADCPWQVELITLLGDDHHSRFVKEETEKAGVSLQYSRMIKGRTCPAYAAIMDGGDLLSGVNDMGLLREMTPKSLEPCVGLLEKADMIVLDANLEQETLEGIARDYPRVPLFAETVSAVKCGRFAPLIPRLFGIKPNRLEAEALTGMKIRTPDEALEAAENLSRQGAAYVFITLGEQGSVYYSRRESGKIGSPPLGNVRDVTGAGDYYLA
ncbi:MAG: bifunctional hydroxymethylpyrimidine kinase/phosphomethylpyrimidine kinase, partial [Spirochaetales bacterium]|nr:bifunctional hydroxymethylpyrimidine kinase/phosphomethylpyrimidine kinase [Spirochaetales bacterium]